MRESKQEPTQQNTVRVTQTVSESILDWVSPLVVQSSLIQTMQQIGQPPSAQLNSNRMNRASASSPPQKPQILLQLQRQYGNRATTQLIQAKLTVGKPDDVYEQEADLVAEQVMRMPTSATQQPIQQKAISEAENIEAQSPAAESLTRQTAPEDEEEEGEKEEAIPTQTESVLPLSAMPDEEDPIQTRLSLQQADNGSSVAVSQNLESRLNNSGSGMLLPDDVRTFMEPRFGADFSSVRVHTDSNAIQMNRDLNAQAFTYKQDIYFGAGKSPGKDALTAHELTHVIQQGITSKSKPTIQRSPGNGDQKTAYPVKVPPDVKTEQELDRYAEVLIFGRVMNMSWKTMGWDVPAYAKQGKTVRYLYDASFVSEQGGKKAGEATKPKSYSPTYSATQGKERQALNEEIDKRYSQGTKTPPGEKIKPGEKSKVDMWNVYRDQVLAQQDDLKKLPTELKQLMGGETRFKPQDYNQLSRIAEKLKKFSPEDIAVYKMLSLRATDNLNLFEKSVDMFLARKEALKEALKKYEEQNKGKDPQKDPQSMQQAMDASWKGFDNSKIGKLSEADQYDLARQQTWEVTKAQLEYMKNHPGETAIDFAKSATLMNTGETFKGIGQDIAEAASGDANAWARWAGGVGAGAKLSGWLLAVGGVLYVLSWLTGVGELATIAAFMGAMLASTIVLSTTESELRIKAASQAKTPEEFKEQITKAAAARTNVILMVALLALALAFKFVAKTFFPETVAKISKSLAKFREKVRIVGKLSEVKLEFATEMEGHRQKLIESGEAAKKNSKAQADAVDQMSLDEFVDRLDSGKGAFAQEAAVQDGQKIQWKSLAKTPEGLKAISAYKAQLADALRNTVPKEIDGLVKEQTDAIDSLLEKAKKATIPEEFEQAIKDHEKFMSEEEVAKRGKAREEQTRKEKAEEALKQIEEEMKKAAEEKAKAEEAQKKLEEETKKAAEEKAKTEEAQKKLEEETKKAAEEKNPYDKLDEHALEKMTEEERAKVFAEEAKRGVHRGVKIRTKDKSIDFELDRVDIKKGVIIEDKIAKGFEKNPKPLEAAKDWAEKQIYKKTKNKIEFIKNKADHVYFDPKSQGSPHLPTIEQVKGIKKFEFRLQVDQGVLKPEIMEALRTEIDAAIKTLKTEFPDWSFEIIFGG
jgi:hypothetical protein